MQGFVPGSAASLAADCVLLLEIVMGAALTLGVVFARRRKFRAHAWCQSAVVVLNLVVISAYMAPTFRRAVEPGIPSRLAKSYYWLATGHGMAGIIAELLGLYVLLVAGTTFLPKSFRFTRYKPWMRSTFVVWWVAILMGVLTYLRWYTRLLR
jgi:uncharacterized membrane protein YozB (DUF420 family)